MKKEETIIMIDSPEAAQQKTVTGWVGGGRFYGDDERMARWAGCTHTYCSICNAPLKKDRTICPACVTKRQKEKYDASPLKAWDGSSYVYSNSHDKYFADADAVEEYIAESEDEWDDPMEPFDRADFIAGLDLMLCYENHLSEVEPSWDDVMPEDMEVEDVVASKELTDKLKELNEIIRKHPAISYSPDKYRTFYEPKSAPAPLTRYTMNQNQQASTDTGADNASNQNPGTTTTESTTHDEKTTTTEAPATDAGSDGE